MAEDRIALPPKQLVVHLVTAINDGNLAALDELLAPEYVLPDGGGRERVKDALVRYRKAVPDAKWVIQEQVAEGETVVTRFLACGTQQGPLLGLPPTGLPMAIAGVLVSRCRGRQIVAQWGLVDLLGMLQQVGIMPALPMDQIAAVARIQEANGRWIGI